MPTHDAPPPPSQHPFQAPLPTPLNPRTALLLAFLLIVGIFIMTWVAGRFDYGPILRFDAPAVQQHINTHKTKTTEQLFQHLKTLLKEIEGDQPFKQIQLNEQTQLLTIREIKTYENKQVQTTTSQTTAHLQDLDALVYITSLDPQARSLDHWSIDVFCAKQKNCIESKTSIATVKKQNNHGAILTRIPKSHAPEIAALVHLLIKAHGGSHQIPYQTMGRNQIVNSYDDPAIFNFEN